MKPIGWLCAAAALSWMAATVLLDRASASAVLLGIIGPFAAVVATWLAVESAARRDLARVTPVMFKAFAVKLVFFGVYVAIVVKTAGVPPIPFVVSFTTCFVAFYVVEALCLQRRLMTAGMHAAK
jgi:hypothetical protein